jgi:superfamily II DNA or RNA helicase
MHYQTFLKSKLAMVPPAGLEPREPHSKLFPFQRDIVKWALRRGRACIFADCGMGKTFMQLSWAEQIPGDVLILAPLAVAKQTKAEGKKLGIEVRYCRSQKQVTPGTITITNYEMVEEFDPAKFAGVVLDESSIIKHFDGKFRNLLISRFAKTPYRLACTATPAPNDHMELGNHAEFVGAMTRTEMLSMFFVHDGGDTSKWRLKGHAEQDFWRWVCSWAVMIRKPSDLGYDDGGFVLPPMRIQDVTVEHEAKGNFLFAMEAQTLQERIGARRESVEARVTKCAELVNASDEPWIIWCNLNSEADAIEDAIAGAVQVKGSDTPDEKAEQLQAFSDGAIRVLVTKPSIAGFGMNWQHCRNVAFVGLSDSWEQYYQAVRRCWRFGQKQEVRVYIITSSAEGAVVSNIKRKEADAARMADEMVKHMHSINEQNIKGVQRMEDAYVNDVARGENWTMALGDCVETVAKLDDESIGYSIFSPPFASLYTYSASNRDMGNCKDYEQFEQHFRFLVRELYRVTKAGRLVSFHCMNLPTSKSHHGYIGLHDFRGDLIRVFRDAGFIFHSEVCIWKDPVTAMQRTKALGLLHKQVVKDSCMSRQGVPDYLVTMRKPGENPQPVEGELDRWIGDNSFVSEGRLSIDLWQRYASPVWMDINASRTLQKDSARDEKDERHICPLQLDVIERAMELWSNPGDVVLSPFAGIGSEGYVALLTGRRFFGVELKPSYWKQAVANLRMAEAEAARGDLFTFAESNS